MITRTWTELASFQSGKLALNRSVSWMKQSDTQRTSLYDVKKSPVQYVAQFPATFKNTKQSSHDQIVLQFYQNYAMEVI